MSGAIPFGVALFGPEKVCQRRPKNQLSSPSLLEQASFPVCLLGTNTASTTHTLIVGKPCERRL